MRIDQNCAVGIRFGESLLGADPDGLSNWCLKEYAELLCQPIANILNSSYKEQKLPSVWKHADVTLLPKVKQVGDP